MRLHSIARATCALVALSSALFAQNAQEDAKLIPLDSSVGTLFGFSSALDNNRAIVGSVVFGGVVANGGKVYLYELQPNGSWLENGELAPTQLNPADLFGGEVSLDGDRAAVGVWLDDDVAMNVGAVVIFERQVNGTWLQVAKVTPSDGQTDDQFGSALKLDGDRLIVSSPFDKDNGVDSGSAYIYERQVNGTWLEVVKLKPLDGAAGDTFGTAVDLEGDIAIVSADFNDDGASGAGSAYSFERLANGMWRQRFKFVAPDPSTNDVFGSAVSLEGDRVLIGARGQDNGSVFQSGEVYEFKRITGTNWTLVQRFQPVTPTVSAEFGSDIQLVGNKAIVSAWVQDGERGATYLFERQTSGMWSQTVQMVPSDNAALDRFGTSIGFDGTHLVAGSYQADPGAKANAGEAYIYNIGSLFHGANTISVSTGGSQPLLLRAGPTKANQVFLILGSASGTSLGIVEPVSGITIPLVFDAYLVQVINSAGAGIIVPYFGFLDANGAGSAAITIPPVAPSFAGITLHHAFITIDVFGSGIMTSASNPVRVVTVP